MAFSSGGSSRGEAPAMAALCLPLRPAQSNRAVELGRSPPSRSPPSRSPLPAVRLDERLLEVHGFRPGIAPGRVQSGIQGLDARSPAVQGQQVEEPRVSIPGFPPGFAVCLTQSGIQGWGIRSPAANAASSPAANAASSPLRSSPGSARQVWQPVNRSDADVLCLPVSNTSSRVSAELLNSRQSELPPENCKLHRLHKEVDASRWCVTLEDLGHFESEVQALCNKGKIPDDERFPNEWHDDPRFGPTIYQVNIHYIMPTTLEAGGMSWALMRHPEGLPCHVFATHCWAEGVFEFLSKVRQAWPVDHEARNLYCCFLANPQNGGINEILQDDPSQSPFAKALRSAKHFLVIPNNKVSIYKRLWCVFEAHLAVEAAKHRGLKITLPSTVPRWTVFRVGLPGIMSFIAGFMLGYFFLARFYGYWLGPLLWLVVSIVFTSLLGTSTRTIAQRCCSNSKVIAWTILASYWSEMLLIGHGLGLALWDLKGFNENQEDVELDRKVQQSFVPGEGWACIPLSLALLVLYMSRIARQVSKSIAKREANLIDFTSVHDAECTCPEDEKRIWKVIRNRTGQIDDCITMLSQAGRYDQALLSNIERGMSARHAREGADPFRIFIAMWTWEYWWVVDLAAHSHHIICIQVPVASCIVVFIFWYYARDHSIFAFDLAFYGGLAFVILSKLFVEHEYFEDGESHFMTKQTLWLQLVGMSLVVIASGYHYLGIRRRLWGAGGNRWSAEMAGQARYLQCDDDSEVEEELAEIGEDFSMVECLTPAARVELSDDEEDCSTSLSGEVDVER